MFSFGKKSVIGAFILFFVIAVVGWAWRQHNSIPYVTGPIQTVITPAEEGVTWVLEHISDVNRIVKSVLKTVLNGKTWKTKMRICVNGLSIMMK